MKPLTLTGFALPVIDPLFTFSTKPHRPGAAENLPRNVLPANVIYT